MSPRARAIAIVAACAGVPFFTMRIWMPLAWRLPVPDISMWLIALAPALIAAFKLPPATARLGLVVQAFVSVILLRDVPYRVPAMHPYVVAPFLLAAGAALAFVLSKGSGSPVPAAHSLPAGRGATPAPAPVAAPPRRSKLKVFLVVVGVLLVLGGFAASCFFIWSWFTRVDRALAKGVYYRDQDERDLLVEHASDEKVHAFFVKELAMAAGMSPYSEELKLLDRVFEKKKPEDTKETVAGVVALVLRDGDEKAKTWLPSSWDDPRVTEEIVAYAVSATKGGVEGVPSKLLPALLPELERRKVVASDELFAAVAKMHVAALIYAEGAGARWLEANATTPARKALVRDALFQACQDAAERSGDKESLRRLKDLAPALARWCVEVTSDDVLERVEKFYLYGGLPVFDPVVKALGPEAASKFRARRERATQFHERQVDLVLACLAGGGTADDVPRLIEQAVRPPILDADYFKKLEAVGLPLAVDRKAEEIWYLEPTRRGLAAIGPQAVAQLTSGLALRTREAVQVCARALGAIDPDALVAGVEKRIDAYNARAPLLAIARDILLRREGDPDTERARQVVRDVYPLSEGVAEGLFALEALAPAAAEKGGGSSGADLCFMHGLSCADESIAKHCATVLKKRLDRDELVAALFRFLAHKESFDVREVSVYESALNELGPAASPAIVKNLETLLARAEGDPAKVYWIHKVIGLRCLAVVGDKDARATIEKYAKDPGSYTHIETKTDTRTKQQTKTETEVPFKTLCEQALAAIERRG